MIKLQYQPNLWSCLPTAFAMCFGIEVERLMSYVGHDGSEIIWPELLEPYCRRGYHIQEMVEVGLMRDYTVLAIETAPVLVIETEPHLKPVTVELLKPIKYYLKKFDGVILGVWPNGNRHSVAYSKGMCYDPNNSVYALSDDVRINLFCPVLKSNHF